MDNDLANDLFLTQLATIIASQPVGNYDRWKALKELVDEIDAKAGKAGEFAKDCGFGG